MAKITTAERIRRYMDTHPDAKPKQIAEATGARLKYIHVLRSTDKKRKALGLPIRRIKRTYNRKFKKVVITANEAAVAQKLGIDLKSYAKGKAELMKWRPPAPLPVPEAPNTLTITMEEPKHDPVNHPAHYKVGGIETIDFIEAKQLTYNLGNVIKYITRADHKGNKYEDLCKARWYLNREIAKHTGVDNQ